MQPRRGARQIVGAPTAVSIAVAIRRQAQTPKRQGARPASPRELDRVGRWADQLLASRFHRERADPPALGLDLHPSGRGRGGRGRGGHSRLEESVSHYGRKVSARHLLVRLLVTLWKCWVVENRGPPPFSVDRSLARCAWARSSECRHPAEWPLASRPHAATPANDPVRWPEGRHRSHVQGQTLNGATLTLSTVVGPQQTPTG